MIYTRKYLPQSWLMAVVLALPLCHGQGARGPRPPVPEAPLRDITAHTITQVTDSVMYVDWCWKTDRLLICRRGVDRFYNVYSVRPDGLNLKLVTLGKQMGNPQQNNGNPTWHPNGDYFAFVSQNTGASYIDSLPGSGLNCNIWVGDKENTNRFWQLTRLSTNYTKPQGVCSPYFSPDGKRLFWSGRTGTYPERSKWGEYALYMADVSFDGRGPRLQKVTTFQPGEQKDFYESHGFSPDGNKIIFSANMEKDQSPAGMDIYSYDKRTNEIKNLTRTMGAWDQHASFSPDGERIAYMSSLGQKIPYLPLGENRWQRHLRSELWIMDAEGKQRKQVTFFNSPSGTIFLRSSIRRRSYVGDSAWSPDGTRIAIVVHHETVNFNIESRLFILQLGVGAPPRTVEEEAAQEPMRRPKPEEDKEKEEPDKKTGKPVINW